MASVILNVRDFGAAGDGKTLDSDAINRTLAGAQPGSTILLPAGTYLSYSIRLRSHVTLHLDRGATLLAAGDPPPPREPTPTMPGDAFGLDEVPAPAPTAKDLSTPLPEKSGPKPDLPPKLRGLPDYDPPEHNPHARYQDHGHSHWHNSLLWGDNLENVAITGQGTIDGRGLTWTADPDRPAGNKAIALKNCRNVRLTDVTICRGGHIAVLASGCDGMTITNLRLDTNGEGLDIDSCRSVSITDCLVNSPNDDAIVLKSSFALGAARPTEDVTIRHCHVSGYDEGTLLDGTRRTTQPCAPDGGGVMGRIKLGTESNGGFRKIVISECTFTHCRGLALATVDGGPMENVTATNLAMRDLTSAPLFIRLGRRARGPAGTPASVLKGVTISQVEVTEAEPRFASLIVGIPGHPVEQVRLSSIRISYRGGGGLLDARAQPPENEDAYPEPNMFGVIPAYGLFCRHVRDLAARDITLAYQKPDHRPPVVLDDVHGATLEKFHTLRHADVPALVMRNVSDIQVDDAGAMKNLRIASLENGHL